MFPLVRILIFEQIDKILLGPLIIKSYHHYLEHFLNIGSELLNKKDENDYE